MLSQFVNVLFSALTNMTETLKELFAKSAPKPATKAKKPEAPKPPKKVEKPATEPKKSKAGGSGGKTGKPPAKLPPKETAKGGDGSAPKKKPDNKEQIANAKDVDDAVKIFHEEPAERDKMRMKMMVENLWQIYGKEGSDDFTDKATHFMGQIKDLFAFSQYDPKDVQTLLRILPDDTCEAIEKSKERMSEYMNFKEGAPDKIVTMRKVMIGWKARLGELIAKYKPLTLAYELGYYSLRGSAFVALTHVGRNLERNIKEASTVKDREQQAQIMTLGISKERVYYDWVVEVLVQNQRALANMIDNMEHELIELRHQRRTEAANPQ